MQLVIVALFIHFDHIGKAGENYELHNNDDRYNRIKKNKQEK